MTDPRCGWCFPCRPENIDSGTTMFLCPSHQSLSDKLGPATAALFIPAQPRSEVTWAEIATSQPTDWPSATDTKPADIIADMMRIADDLTAAEESWRAWLRTFAAAGATPEQIGAAAVDRCIRRFPAVPGALNWGATAADFGRAVVEALRITGHLPNGPCAEGCGDDAYVIDTDGRGRCGECSDAFRGHP